MENNKEILEAIKSMIKAYDTAIAHYDFVISDLSSEIYDPALQNTKEPVIAFLKTMRAQWEMCKNDTVETYNRYRGEQ